MRRSIILLVAAALAALLVVGCAKPPEDLVQKAKAALQAAEVFVTIGGGDPAGVYFPVGRAIAVILNQGRSAHGIRATVEAWLATQGVHV